MIDGLTIKKLRDSMLLIQPIQKARIIVSDYNATFTIGDDFYISTGSWRRLEIDMEPWLPTNLQAGEIATRRNQIAGLSFMSVPVIRKTRSEVFLDIMTALKKIERFK